MGEFRLPTHNKRYSKKSVNRLVLMVLVLLGIIYLVMRYADEFAAYDGMLVPDKTAYYPEAVQGSVYHRPWFSLSYVEQYELPEWVSYELNVGMMNKPKHKRDQDFNPDPAIRSGSGHYHDYKGSGYRRGHLVPSADMAWKKEAMDATFLLSNVAPMREVFNDGIWLELENNVRDWSRKYTGIYVVTGPIFQDATETIGDNEILVPKYFFKAVFTVHDDLPEVIGFLFDQEAEQFSELSDYVVSIDSIEQMTGIELFSNLYGDWDTEIKMERRVDVMPDKWPFNDKWANQRQK